ncbi:MAG: hypothetical protein K1000chlam3_01177, partial [Chlamydiae bacterium]|nr:hypothetical protein [Chlamydiota bacterium]
MNFSLSNHVNGYQTSFSDLLTSVVTGASGIPFANRHYELSKVESTWAHRLIALIEYLPILGGSVALIERLAYSLFGEHSILWQKETVSSQATLKRMIKNQRKAQREHYNGGPYFGNPYSQTIALSETDLTKKKATNLKLSHHFADAQGLRLTMEDAHFYKEMEKGTLTGVFDGHGGSKVSAYASKEFQNRFPKALKEANGNVHQAFEKVIDEIHLKVAQYSAWDHEGSTAVVCYIDKETHQIYTATLGDSEANIYRKSGQDG